MYQVSDKAVAVCCPLCSSRDISVAVESVIADSYYCAHCRAYFAVTAAFPPPQVWMTTTTNDDYKVESNDYDSESEVPDE
jgi:hypothetical protein